jgi:hypothetical protein
MLKHPAASRDGCAGATGGQWRSSNGESLGRTSSSATLAQRIPAPAIASLTDLTKRPALTPVSLKHCAQNALPGAA